jgi:hypothetical protein
VCRLWLVQHGLLPGLDSVRLCLLCLQPFAVHSAVQPCGRVSSRTLLTLPFAAIVWRYRYAFRQPCRLLKPLAP